MVREPAPQDGSLGTGTYHTSLTNELNPQETLKGEKGKPALFKWWEEKSKGARGVALLVECLLLQQEDLNSDPSPRTTASHGTIPFNPSTVEGAEAEPWSLLISQSHQWQISVFSERPWDTQKICREQWKRQLIWTSNLHTQAYLLIHKQTTSIRILNLLVFYF